MEKRALPKTEEMKKRTSLRQSRPTPRPRILIACGDGDLCLGLAVLLCDITPHIDIVRTKDELEERSHTEHYDLIITRFVSLLVGTRSLPRRLRHEGLSPRFFALAPLGNSDSDVELSLRILEGGTTQLFSLPVSAARLHKKAEDELEMQNSKLDLR